jgi:phytoene dehydrogenase-like protein
VDVGALEPVPPPPGAGGAAAVQSSRKNPDINKAFVYVIGYESTKELKKHWDEMREGKLSATPAFNCCFPSVHDPYQAPPGKCSGLISQMAPYNLNGDKNKWLRIKFKEGMRRETAGGAAKICPQSDQG